MYKSKFLT